MSHRRTCVVGTLLAFVLSVAGLQGAAPARAGAARGPLAAAGRYLEDPSGRVVILHGLFAVWKQPPYYPASDDDPSQPSLPSFTAGDADAVSSLGLNAVRLAWYWEGLEPSPGDYSAAYLEGIAAAEGKLARRGIFTVLDSHQDQYDELFGNKPGFPHWAALSDGLPLAPDPGDAAYAAWKFPLGYFQPATGRAFGNLYANRPAAGVPLWRAYGRAWQVVARRLRNDPMVAGYDLMNEPFPGTTSPTDPYVAACTAAPGCSAFDRDTLEPFETSLARAIRAVDNRRTVFYEPTIFLNTSVPNGFVAPPAGVAPAGLSFHNQCPTRSAYATTKDPSLIEKGYVTCPPIETRTMRNATAVARRLGGPALMTEVAATSDDDVRGLNCLLERADRFRTGYTYGLSWSNPDKELRRLGAESEPSGKAPFKQQVLARVYPRAIAGRPLGYGFDVRTGRFRLRYEKRRHVRAPTVISVPAAIQYPGGYRVRVLGARVTSRPGASLLTLATRGTRRTVVVTVAPAPGDTTPRPGFPPCPG